MKRRTSPMPAPDRRADLPKWSNLVALTHGAVEADHSQDAALIGSALKALADRALAAETCWVEPVAYPRNLQCRVLARIAFAYSRQTDAAWRARLAPLMLAAAGMVDELIAEASAEPVARNDSADALAYLVAGLDVERTAAPRLPYRED